MKRQEGATPTAWAGTWPVLRAVLIVLAVLGALWLVYQLRTLILLIVFSLLFAYLIAPIVAVIQRRVAFGRSRELSTGVAIGIAYVILFGAIAISIAWVAPRLV